MYICAEDKKGFGYSRGFTKRKSRLTDVTDIYWDCLSGWERSGCVYFDFRKTFDALSNIILTDKLMKHELDKWTVKGTENWLSYWVQRVVISSTKSIWSPVASWVLQGSVLGLTLFNNSINNLDNCTKDILSKFAGGKNQVRIVQIVQTLGLHQEEHCLQVKKSEPSCLLSSGEMSGVWHPVLGLPVQERNRHIGKISVKEHKK